MELFSLAVLFAAGILVSLFATYTGGGSFVTIPLLAFLGLSPLQAIGSNRLAALGAIGTPLLRFHEKKLVDWNIGLTTGVLALAGGIVGALFVLQVPEKMLEIIIAAVTLVFAGVMLAHPNLGMLKKEKRLRKRDWLMGGVLFFFVSIYSGFYGAGAGILNSFILIWFFGQTFMESIATRKITTFLPSAAAAAIFLLTGGIIIWDATLALFAGNVIGAVIAVSYADNIKQEWLRYVFIALAVVLTAKLFL